MQKNFKKMIIFSILICLFALFCMFFIWNKQNKYTQKKFVFWSIQLKPIYEKQINKIISNFEKIHPDYKVIWVDIPIQEAQKRTLASILSSTPPDLINLNPDFSHILAQRNALDYFKENEVLKYHPKLVEKLRYKGKIYGLPFYATSPVTIYNNKYFTKCQIENFPKTYDELYKISPKLNSCIRTTVFASSLNENDTLYKILNKYDIQTFKNKKEQDETIKIFSMFNDMYKKNYMPKDTLAINHREIIEKYMSRQTLVIVAGSNFIKMIKQNAPDIYSTTQIAPQLTGSNHKYDVSLMNLVIPKKAKNKDLAREFASILTNKENQLELAKATNVLCANKYALEDEYFKNCSNDIEQKSRCESVKQLNNIIVQKTEINNKKALNDTLNSTLEKILLDKKSNHETIKANTDSIFKNLNTFFN